MSGLLSDSAPSGSAPSRPRSRLRLVDGPKQEPPRALPGFEQALGVDVAVPPIHDHVLVVGVDVEARARMLGELRDVLPCSTRFVETQKTWEALTLAEGSQMVLLVGDLEELSGTSLVRLLARRQPTLPVLAVGGGAPPCCSSATSG